MMKLMTIIALSLILSPGIVLAQQSSGYPAVDSAPSAGTGPSPAKQGMGSSKMGGNAQTCTDSCNRSYEVCMDQDSALPGDQDALRNSNSAASNLIGASSDCKDHLSSCLNTCGG